MPWNCFDTITYHVTLYDKEDKNILCKKEFEKILKN